MPLPFTEFDAAQLRDSASRPPPLPTLWNPGLLDPDGLITVPGRLPAETKAQIDVDRALLANVQANILRAHGRSHAALLVFRAGPGRRSRDFWSDVLDAVTSAARQRAQAKIARHARENRACIADAKVSVAMKNYTAAIDDTSLVSRVAARPEDEICRSFLLTATGLTALGVADDLAQPLRFEGSAPGNVSSFNLGMKVMAAQKNEDVSHWASEYLGTIDGAWLVACSDQRTLAAEIAARWAWCRTHDLDPVVTELGTDWRPLPATDSTKPNPPREPFGFVDGISNPAFLADDFLQRRMGGPGVDGGLAQVLITPDQSPRHAGGSFMVLRKLEQDLAAFRRLESQLVSANAGGLGNHAAAVLVGRHRNGDPLGTPSPGASGQHPQNAFTFDDNRCPYHAHIRKMNPSGALSAGDRRAAQMARRGMVFDPNLKVTLGLPGDTTPDRGTGLLFMAYMSNLWTQFELLQWGWSAPDFPAAGTEADPVLHPSRHWRWAGINCPMDPLVRVHGGAYFYVPSRTWLARLA